MPPTVSAREVRNLQNFFPFSRREEEEEALEDDVVKEEERNDDPDKDPVGFLLLGPLLLATSIKRCGAFYCGKQAYP